LSAIAGFLPLRPLPDFGVACSHLPLFSAALTYFKSMNEWANSSEFNALCLAGHSHTTRPSL
jgi:hypothetical protein